MTLLFLIFQTDKINNKIWKIARKVPYFALSFEKEEIMSMKEGTNLVIVESPGKIDKIKKARGEGFVV